MCLSSLVWCGVVWCGFVCMLLLPRVSVRVHKSSFSFLHRHRRNQTHTRTHTHKQVRCTSPRGLPSVGNGSDQQQQRQQQPRRRGRRRRRRQGKRRRRRARVATTRPTTKLGGRGRRRGKGKAMLTGRLWRRWRGRACPRPWGLRAVSCFWRGRTAARWCVAMRVWVCVCVGVLCLHVHGKYVVGFDSHVASHPIPPTPI
jgi:hypothetical protein